MPLFSPLLYSRIPAKERADHMYSGIRDGLAQIYLQAALTNLGWTFVGPTVLDSVRHLSKGNDLDGRYWVRRPTPAQQPDTTDYRHLRVSSLAAMTTRFPLDDLDRDFYCRKIVEPAYSAIEGSFTRAEGDHQPDKESGIAAGIRQLFDVLNRKEICLSSEGANFLNDDHWAKIHFKLPFNVQPNAAAPDHYECGNGTIPHTVGTIIFLPAIPSFERLAFLGVWGAHSVSTLWMNQLVFADFNVQNLVRDFLSSTRPQLALFDLWRENHDGEQAVKYRGLTNQFKE